MSHAQKPPPEAQVADAISLKYYLLLNVFDPARKWVGNFAAMNYSYDPW
jgi:hypothetical protein